MIPPLDAVTGNLPAGSHEATWEEIITHYGYTPHRLSLLAGLKRALDSLHTAGCQRAYLDGSFVTAKIEPGDYDGCWEGSGVQGRLLDPVLLDMSNKRTAQKAKYGGEMFLANSPADRFGMRYLDFFQRDRVTGDRKGIIAIDLGRLP